MQRRESDRESGSGNGRSDISLKTKRIRNGRAIILEVKVADRFQDMERKCEEALRQIEDNRYEYDLRDEGYEDISKYGICFYKKECWIEKNGDL